MGATNKMALHSLSDSDPSVTITLDLFTVSLLLAGLLFGFALVLAKRKYALLRRANPSFDLKKLLVLSAGTACFLRIMSFVGVVAMDIANVRAHYSLNKASHHRDEGSAGAGAGGGRHPIDRNQGFYDASMTVLFDLPNAIVISSYLLLTLVWAECSLLSRFHTESSQKWRKRWLLWYTVFNSGLYATQVVMYVLIFAGGGDGASREVETCRNVVNVAMAGINLSAVFLVFLLYLYVSVAFSGYPYRSRSSEASLRTIGRVTAFWSVTRIVWGASMLVIYVEDVDLLRPEGSGGSAAFALFLLLVLCEIAPILVLMDHSFATIVGFDDAATREMSSLATGRHVLASSGGGGDGGSPGSDERGAGERRGGEDEEAPPAVPDDASFCESGTEPLLGRKVS